PEACGTAVLSSRRAGREAARAQDGRYVAAIEQGTTSSRCMGCDHDRVVVAVAQQEHAQHFRRPGRGEDDAAESWQNVQEVVAAALADAGLTASDIAAIGITNQRETTVVWDRATGEPVADAIVWQDTRTDSIVKRLDESVGVEWFRDRTGL